MIHPQTNEPSINRNEFLLSTLPQAQEKNVDINKNFDTDYILKFRIVKFADSFSNKITHKKQFV